MIESSKELRVDLVRPPITEERARDIIQEIDSRDENAFDTYEKGLEVLCKLIDQQLGKSLQPKLEKEKAAIEESGQASPQILKAYDQALADGSSLPLLQGVREELKTCFFTGKQGVKEPKHDKKFRNVWSLIKRVSPQLLHAGFMSNCFLDGRLRRRNKQTINFLEEEGIDNKHPVKPLLLACMVVNQAEAKMLRPVRTRIKNLLNPKLEIPIRNIKNYFSALLKNEWVEYCRGFAVMGQEEIKRYAEEIFGEEVAETALSLWQSLIFLRTSKLVKAKLLNQAELIEIQKDLVGPLIAEEWDKAIAERQIKARAYWEMFPKSLLRNEMHLELAELIPYREVVARRKEDKVALKEEIIQQRREVRKEKEKEEAIELQKQWETAVAKAQVYVGRTGVFLKRDKKELRVIRIGYKWGYGRQYVSVSREVECLDGSIRNHGTVMTPINFMALIESGELVFTEEPIQE